MDAMERLRAWGTAHAQARRAEQAARQNDDPDSSGDLRLQAKSLRERADRLHREAYGNLDGRGRDTAG